MPVRPIFVTKNPDEPLVAEYLKVIIMYEGCSESFETGSIFSVGEDKIKQEFTMYYFNTSSFIV